MGWANSARLLRPTRADRRRTRAGEAGPRLSLDYDAPGREAHAMRRLAETFLVFLSLGLTSFGGPVAHLGYFHDAFVTRRKWLSEADYADLVALCQAIPGPASSQVGM